MNESIDCDNVFFRYSSAVKQFYKDRGEELAGEVIAQNYDGVSHIAFMSDDLVILDEARILIKKFLANKKSNDET